MVSLIQPASPLAGNAHYQRHQPERTLLYQLVQRHYPTFCALMAKTERPLPDFVHQEFEAYLKCGRLEHGFLRVQCQSCKHEDLVAFSCKKRGFCPSCGAKRMVEKVPSWRTAATGSSFRIPGASTWRIPCGPTTPSPRLCRSARPETRPEGSRGCRRARDPSGPCERRRRHG